MSFDVILVWSNLNLIDFVLFNKKKKVVPVCVPQIGLSSTSTERKLQCSSIFKVHWISSGLTREGVARRGTRLEMGLVRFQLCLYHKLESPAQFTSVKNCPRREHTLDLAQSVCCSGPQACNVVRHCCLLVLHSSGMGKTAGGLLTKTNDLEVFKYHSYLETLLPLLYYYFLTHLADVSEFTADQMKTWIFCLY